MNRPFSPKPSGTEPAARPAQRPLPRSAGAIAANPASALRARLEAWWAMAATRLQAAWQRITERMKRRPSRVARTPKVPKPRKPFPWKQLGIAAGVAFTLIIAGGAALFAYYAPQLPNPKKIQNRAIAQSTKILDRNGTKLYEFHGEENRTIVTGEQISDNLKKATVAVEDSEFYIHKGFSLKGLLRSVLARIIPNWRAAGGGSTLTQQYIKNGLVGNDYSLDRKLRELILAVEIERIYTKDEILTGYLNEISYGNSNYGIEAASQNYFGKPAKDLTLSEAAVLAAIPNQSTRYSPYGIHLDELFARKDYVLDRMVATGVVSKQDADAAKQAEPTFEKPTFKQPGDLVAPHFVFYVKDQLIEALGGDPAEAERRLDQEGFVVTTSLDLPTQQLGEKILGEMGPDAVKKWQGTNAALTAVDPKTGEVLAMVGSIGYTTSKSGNTNFALANLQPGSSIKPVVYATAFGPDNKYAPSSVTYDVATDFGGYAPKNYDGSFRGPMTNRQALAGSLNIPAVKNLFLAGTQETIDTAKRLGISTYTRPAGEYGLSLALGAGEVRQAELVGAYSAFANGGMRFPLRPILTIQKDGQMVKDFRTTPASKAVEPEVAYQISSILSDNGARTYVFGAKNNLVLADRAVAAKSGTTDNNRDAWTVGYTPQIAAGVWVGNNDPGKTMTKGADGSYVAGPIWNRFMREYLAGKPVAQFDRPASIKEIEVDKLSGKLPSDQSPADQRIKDIFAPWQVPTTQDDVHVKVKIDKLSGKLATELTPESSIEERTYASIRSEAPDKQNWEDPVQDWAKANNLRNSPPTEKDDIHTEANRPTITITSPGATATGATVTATAEAGGAKPIIGVSFTLNGIAVGTDTEAPWSLVLPEDSLGTGSQTLSATATNDIGMTRTTQVTFSYTKPEKTSLAAPTAILAMDGVKTLSQPIRVSWKNTAETALTQVAVYLSTTNDAVDLGTKQKTVAVTPGSDGQATVEVTGLAAGKTYYVTLRSIDAAGTEGVPSAKTPAKVL